MKFLFSLICVQIFAENSKFSQAFVPVSFRSTVYNGELGIIDGSSRRTGKSFKDHVMILPVTATTEDLEEDVMEDFGDESTETDIIDTEGEKELVFQFIEMVQESPAGELDLNEIDLLREIMADFPEGVSPVEKAQFIELLLYRLLDEWEAALNNGDDEKEEAFRPISQDFALAIDSWQRSENDDRLIHMLSMLSDQRELYMNGLTTVKPELSTIRSLMEILAESREQGVEKRAKQVFDSLADYDLTADHHIYGLLVTILAKSRTRGAAKRADKLLREAVEIHPPQLVNGVKSGIGVDVFNKVVTAYAKSSETDGPARAEQLIVLMDQLDADSGSLGICNPNAHTFTSLIDAYAQQNEWDSVSQAHSTLNRLLEQYLEGNEDLEPTVATWTIVISAWARLSKKNRRGAEDRAGKLLKRMEELYQEGRISCKPDAITYVTCMNAYAFARSGTGAEEAERLLNEMNELYIDGDDTMKPSVRSIKIVADAWIKGGNMDSAEELLDRYDDFLISDGSPDMASQLRDMYRSMLFGYAQEDEAERAQFYLEYMIENGLKPDSFCFDRIIEANTRINEESSLKRSLSAFETMEKCRRAGDLEPNERVYTSFIRAMTKGRAPGLHHKAEVLLQRMNKLYESGSRALRPTVFTYNAVLHACATSAEVTGTDLDDAFKTSVRVFTELRKNRKEHPDHVTFGNMLRCAALLPEGEKKDKYVTATFRLCCEQGLVNNFVIRDLQNAVDEDLWRSLVGCPSGEVDMEMLPSDWTFLVEKPKEKRRGGNRW